MAPTITVRLGNVAPATAVRKKCRKEDAEIVERIGGENVFFKNDKEPAGHLGITPKGEDGPDGVVTTFRLPASMKIAEGLSTVSRNYAQSHSFDPPEWVECPDSPGLEAALAEQFTVTKDEIESLRGTVPDGELPGEHTCRVGKPKSWKEPDADPGLIAGGSFECDALIEELVILGMDIGEAYRLAFLRTNAGADHQSRVMADTASNATATYAAANYIALTENATAPAVGDTTLTGELTLSGLGRAQAAYAHTNGTTSYTLTKTFTSADATARTINKCAVFNAASTGTMVFETALASPPTLQSGDSLTVTETVALV